jgi:hypothetical protein
MSLASQILSYVTLISVIVAFVLAVARDAPILHLLAMPETGLGDWIGLVYGLPAVLLFYFGYAAEGAARPWLLAGAWITALAYFWVIVVCNLRDQR